MRQMLKYDKIKTKDNKQINEVTGDTLMEGLGPVAGKLLTLSLLGGLKIIYR